MAMIYNIKILAKNTETGEETEMDGESLHDCEGFCIYTKFPEHAGGYVHDVSLSDIAEMLACDESLRPAVMLAARYIREMQTDSLEVALAKAIERAIGGKKDDE